MQISRSGRQYLIDALKLGLPGVWYLTGLSGILALSDRYKNDSNTGQYVCQ